MHQRQKKNEKADGHPKNSWRLQKNTKYPGNQIREEESTHHKNKKWEKNASNPEKELQMSLEISTKTSTKTMIKMNLDKNYVETKTKAALICNTTTLTRGQESQISRLKSCKLQSTNSKKRANSQTAMVSEPCDEETREMVRQIFNEIIKRNEFTPEDWKKVTIKVTHKKGDVEIVSNYLPICSLLVLYKLFSTILYGRLYPVLDQKQAEDQSGFRKSYQTTHHLAAYSIIEQKCHEWRIKMWTATVVFTKAFDSITHKSIWDALKYCTSNMVTSASWSRFTETKKHLYRLTKRVSFSRSEKEPSRVTRCQACCLTRFSNTHWDILRWQKKKRNGHILER